MSRQVAYVRFRVRAYAPIPTTDGGTLRTIQEGWEYAVANQQAARTASALAAGSQADRLGSRRGRRHLEAPARNFEGRQARPDRALGETKKAPGRAGASKELTYLGIKVP
jgi:hypothetical protein